MKAFFLASIILAGCQAVGQQLLTSLPIGGNKRAVLREQVGLVKVTITYNRPAVKGREGMIWGKLVHQGFIPLGLSEEPSPWRAGANENTTIEFSDSVRINGIDLTAGKYGFFIAYSPDESEIIFSKTNNSWGSFFYKAGRDALRVKSKPSAISNSVEWLRFLFEHQSDSSADIQLEWEKKRVSFRVNTDYKAQQLKLFRTELAKKGSDNWMSWTQAAEWCLERNINLEEALSWTDSAIIKAIGVDSLFQPFGIKAELLSKLNRQPEAEILLAEKMPIAGVQEKSNYAMLLLRIKKFTRGLAILKKIRDDHPGEYPYSMSLAYGFAINQDKQKAIEAAKSALLQAKTSTEKVAAEILIEQLRNSSFRLE